jgi:hypothetical protein
VINAGISVDRVERVTHRRVERLRVQEVNSRTAAGLGAATCGSSARAASS